MGRVLIVANQTAAGPHLRREIEDRARAGQRSFTLLIPATRPYGTIATEVQDRVVAGRRLDNAIRSLKDLDIDLDGLVRVAATPFDAVVDLSTEREFDEIIISTLPNPVSHWMRMDLPSRVARWAGKPVTHIVVPVRTGATSAA
jgi:hypothetical protein